MTSEERLDRIEHLTAGWIEQSRNEHRENRQLWRETQQQIQALTEQFERYQTEAREQMKAIREEMAGRDRVTDERIRELVTAIGEFIRKSSNGK